MYFSHVLFLYCFRSCLRGGDVTPHFALQRSGMGRMQTRVTGGQHSFEALARAHADMKFLQIQQFEEITVALSQLENEECRLQLRLDPYSCAAAAPRALPASY